MAVLEPSGSTITVQKVREAVSALSAQKAIGKKKKLRSRQKKLKAYDLSSLTEFLPELKAPRQPTPATELKLNFAAAVSLCTMLLKHVFGNNGFIILSLKEGRQLNTVLNHPAFLSDPLAAIHQHIQSTQPVTDEKPKKKANKNGGRKRKGKRSMASDGTQSMVM
ncbi:hypothetical protein CJ030_MR7G022715 [Morella rubra]|uniref:Uncharacterized protein n=1 Tax=Morella rubra TaxID=262757 RepID=A0A6A1V9E9_9ROSI|nr:hypothetical protein CJ030_MR7G022715 [Morella rubra]